MTLVRLALTRVRLPCILYLYCTVSYDREGYGRASAISVCHDGIFSSYCIVQKYQAINIKTLFCMSIFSFIYMNKYTIFTLFLSCYLQYILYQYHGLD